MRVETEDAGMTIFRTFIRTAVTLLVTVSALLVHGQAFGGELRELAGGVYIYNGGSDDSPQNSFGANAGIIIGEDGTLVVDTLISSKAAAGFIDAIRKVTDKPVKYVVNTHGHLDHAFGNSEFVKIGATVVAHEDSRDYLEKSGEEVLNNPGAYGISKDDLAGTIIEYPSITFRDAMKIDLGGRIVELLYLGPSHSPGSIVVYLPDERVLFTGDILFTDSHPFLGEGDLDGWLNALDSAKALDALIIIPGHGPVSDSGNIEEMKEYITAFDGLARKLSAESNDPDFISSEIIKSLPERAMGASLVKWNVQMRYLDDQ